jgi:hypothetical protein
MNQGQVTYVDLDGLRRVLSVVVGPTPATIVAETPVKMNKTDNPFYDQVTKVQESNVFINFSYENAVNKRLTKEGKEADFEAQPRKWGVHVPGTPLVLHKGQYYLEAGFITKNAPKASYMHNGEPIDKELFERYVPVKKSSGNQGLEKEVVIRDFKLENVRSIKMNGMLYVRNDF